LTSIFTANFVFAGTVVCNSEVARIANDTLTLLQQTTDRNTLEYQEKMHQIGQSIIRQMAASDFALAQTWSPDNIKFVAPGAGSTTLIVRNGFNQFSFNPDGSIDVISLQHAGVRGIVSQAVDKNNVPGKSDLNDMLQILLPSGNKVVAPGNIVAKTVNFSFTSTANQQIDVSISAEGVATFKSVHGPNAFHICPQKNSSGSFFSKTLPVTQ
jgi:hypothetical protein